MKCLWCGKEECEDAQACANYMTNAISESANVVSVDKYNKIVRDYHKLVKAVVDLTEAIHSDPCMSGKLKNLHISPVRGAEPLRRVLCLLSEMEPFEELKE